MGTLHHRGSAREQEWNLSWAVENVEPTNGAGAHYERVNNSCENWVWNGARPSYDARLELSYTLNHIVRIVCVWSGARLCYESYDAQLELSCTIMS